MNKNDFYKAHAANLGITGSVSNWNEYSDKVISSGLKKGVAVPNAAAAPTQAEFNALLTALRNANIIAP